MHEKTIEEAKKRLLGGQLVIFPTETVYGIGGNAINENAIKLIYQEKKRPFDNPLICHFANINEIEEIYVNRGPGSFAGIRSSLSIVKGYYLTRKIDYYCFSFNDFKGLSDIKYKEVPDLCSKFKIKKNLIKPIYLS